MAKDSSTAIKKVRLNILIRCRRHELCVDALDCMVALDYDGAVLAKYLNSMLSYLPLRILLCRAELTPYILIAIALRVLLRIGCSKIVSPTLRAKEDCIVQPSQLYR